MAAMERPGRRKDWLQAERFNYLYSKAELRDLAAHLKELSENAEETHALFNNCYRDYGQRNAIDFQRLLSSA
jgi:uncharacterized protein YecE (DUF72 family)